VFDLGPFRFSTKFWNDLNKKGVLKKGKLGQGAKYERARLFCWGTVSRKALSPGAKGTAKGKLETERERKSKKKRRCRGESYTKVFFQRRA